MTDLGLGSVVFRWRFRANPFVSEEFDALASRMGVLQKMSSDPADRWFLGRVKGVYSTGSRVLMGNGTKFRLTSEQLLAATAHELAHIREGDAAALRKRVVLPLYLGWACALILIFAALVRWPAWWIVIVGVSLVPISFVLLAYLISFANAGWRRRIEVRADVIAASYVNGHDLIDALRVEDASVAPGQRRTLSYRVRSRSYPSLEERANAILAVEKGKVQSQN